MVYNCTVVCFQELKRPKLKIISVALQHGLRTPRERFFFQKSETFWLGQTNWAQIFWGIWGIYLRANYQHYFGTVISLSMVNVSGSFSYNLVYFDLKTEL